ncbi:hypothetical protein JWG39_02790 [Desulforhopalus vacuolatus]|uniref:hypothetical protein n=1 Tax=Desulforhopalus vacuolatus TaxID=40414 RepID=UPI0019627B2C|nr:hypothetical protein [Desulforhopalus vacuolatus]MBM9518745.1 hypothetical protein [Desulforhopalus vacuolatus]
MMKNIFCFLLLFLTLITLGCAKPAVNFITIPDISKSDSVTLKDLRPEKEKSIKVLSYLITSNAYGINREGGDSLEPSMPRILQHRVYEKLGGSNSALELTVYHMVVYSNMQAQMKGSVLWGTLAGPVGGAVAAAGSNDENITSHSSIVDPVLLESTNTKDEYKHGLYTEKENPNKTNVLITYIDAGINGRRVCIKNISPLPFSKNQHPLNIALESAIDYYLDQYQKNS